MSMNKNTILSIVLIFSLAFNIAFAGIWVYNIAYVEPKLEEARQDKEPARPDTPAKLALEKWQNIGLKPEQRKTLIRLRRKLHQKLKKDRAEVEEARSELLELLQQPDADAQAIEIAHKNLARAQQELREAVMTNLMHVRKNLSEDQRREFGRMLHRRKGGHPHGARSRPRRPGMRGRGAHSRGDESRPENNHEREPF